MNMYSVMYKLGGAASFLEEMGRKNSPILTLVVFYI